MSCNGISNLNAGQFFIDSVTVLKGLPEGGAFWIILGHTVWERVNTGHMISTLWHSCLPQSLSPFTTLPWGIPGVVQCGQTLKRDFCEPAEPTVTTTPGYWLSKDILPRIPAKCACADTFRPNISCILSFLGQISQNTFLHRFPRVWPT